MQSSEANQLADEAQSEPIFQFERRERIVERALAEGRVEVSEIAATFGVTHETIRRDLTYLENEHLLRRVHGGAVPFRHSLLTEPLRIREERYVDEKRRIARAAALEIPESGSLIIDSGSTTEFLAEFIDRDRELTVITNSIPLIRSLATTERPTVIALGGVLRRRSMAFVDLESVATLREMTVDVAFIGCDGASIENGLTSPFRSEVAVKRAMMSSARRTVAMLDHSKIGNDRLLRFATLGDIDKIVTGVEVDEAIASRFEEYGPVVVRA